MQRRHEWFARRLDPPVHFAHQGVYGHLGRAELADVGAAAEHAPGAAKHDRIYAGVGEGRFHLREQPLPQLEPEAVHRRVVQDDVA